MATELDQPSIILRNLLTNEEFTRKVFPYMEEKYFDGSHTAVFRAFKTYFDKYNALPTKESLAIDLADMKGFNDKTISDALETVDALYEERAKPTLQWAVDTAEKFIKERALYLALTESISIVNGDPKASKNLSRTAIPGLLQDALAVGFESDIGHDYIADAESRYWNYHDTPNKVPFLLPTLNAVTNGGIELRTLNCITGGVHVGKTAVLCSLACDYFRLGHKVLYVTLEMSEEKISERFDANLMGISTIQLPTVQKDRYDAKIKKLSETYKGGIVVKQFPTSQAHIGHIRHLLHELKAKEQFVPTIVIVDYINLMASYRLKAGSMSDSYTYIMAIAQELRGLAIEKDLAIWTATQFNREGFRSEDPNMAHTAESFGLPATLDLQWGIYVPEQLASSGQLFFNQFKNRYGNKAVKPKFGMSMNYDKMTLEEPSAAMEAAAEAGFEQEAPATSYTKRFGTRPNFGVIKP